MAHVHYKFSSKLKYDTMVFDGLNITLKDLKRQIMDREKLRAADCDLQITNAQTKEEYKDDEDLIAKNSSIIVRRIPMVGVKSSGSKTTSKTMSKTTDRSDNQFHHHAFGSSKAMDNQSFSRSLTLLSQTCNLANANASEEDKIQAMMSQSNHEYDPMNYVKKHGPPPPNYTCFRCGMNGHHIRNCPTNGDKTFESLPKIKKSTGIPRSFMVEVDDPNIKGAMLTHCGRYAIPTIDAEAYAKGKKERPPFAPPQPQAAGGEEEEEKKKKKQEEEAVPTELLCLICREMLHDAVLIPCCGNSYCDDCIRSALLESDEHVCPTCDKVDVSPDTLVANKFLRQAVNSFNNEVGNMNSLAATGPSTPMSQMSNPSPSPHPPPVSSTQIRPKTPYQQTRHQQDPLMSRPPPAHTPPLVQPNTMSPVATAASSACSTPVNSPQRPQNQPDAPGSKEAEAEVSSDAAEPFVPSGSSSPTEGPVTPPPLMPPGYHVPVADLESTSPNNTNTQMSPTYPTDGHSEQPPVKESASTPSGLVVGGAWTYPTEGPGPSLPPPLHPSSGPPPILPPPPVLPLPPPAVSHPPPNQQHFHPPPSPFPAMPFPPYPGFPPGYPFTAPPWAPPSLPSICPTVPPPTLPSTSSSTSTSIPPLIPKEEMYQHQRRMRERSSSGRGPNRDRQTQHRPQPTVDEMGGDFAKELLEYRRMQKQRRRSYSRSPQRSSSVSQMSSDSYSRSRSYSRSPSRSPGRLRSRGGRSRSRSRSRSRPRHRRRSARRHADRSHYHGYKRSGSPTPPSSSPSRRRRSSRSRSGSRSRSWGSRQKTSAGGRRRHRHRARSHRDHHGNPGKRRTPSSCDHYRHHAGCDVERYRLWEKEYMEWYEKYFGNYTGKPHHLQPPPLLPTPLRPGCGRPAPTSDQRPYPSSSCSSKYTEAHPRRASSAKRSRTPLRQSPDCSPSPASDEDSGSLTYQQRCSEMYGHQGSHREGPETKVRARPAPERSATAPTAYRPPAMDPGDQSHKKKRKRGRGERDGADIGEAEESPPLGTSCPSPGRGRREGRSKHDSPGSTPVRDVTDPGDEAWGSPYAGTLRGDGGRRGRGQPGDEGSAAEPSRAGEAGRPKDGDPRPDHSMSGRKRRREEEGNGESPRKELLLGDRRPGPSSHGSENAKSGRGGEYSMQGTGRKPSANAEKGPGTRQSPTESPLWEGVTKMRKPERKTISININLGGQPDEALKAGEAEPTAGSLAEEEKTDAGDENEDAATGKAEEEDVEDKGRVKNRTSIRKATEEPVGGGEMMKTMEKKRNRGADGGKVMEEEEEEDLRAGTRARQSGEEPGEWMEERAKAPGRRSQSTSAAGETVHARRDLSEERQERKMKTKSLENYSSKDGFLHPEDKMVLMKVRSRREPLEGEDEEPAGKEEPPSTEAQHAAAACGPVSVAVPKKRATARDGDTPEDVARAPRRWEAEREKEPGRSRETARRRSREVEEGGFAPASPVRKEPSTAPERRASPAHAGLGYNPGSSGRGEGKDGRGQQGRRAKESERASGERKSSHSSRSTSSSWTAGDKRGREPDDGRARNPERGGGGGGPGAGGTSQSSSSSRSSSSSSSSFSQPDGVPQQAAAAAASVSGGGRRGDGRYREHDAAPSRRDRKAVAAHREMAVATPPDRHDDSEAGKHHHHHHRRPHPQHRRNQDNHHEHHPVREQRDHRSPTERPPGAPQPGGHAPGGSERRDPRPASSQRSAQQGAGADPPGGPRGPDKPRLDVFSRGRDALLRPRKPIDIKIISGASLFQHANLEEKNRV